MKARFPATTHKGEATRKRVLDAAVELAAVEGLSGLSFGTLGERVAMSKAALVGYFGTKEELQLATVTAAEMMFIERVIEPAMRASEGLPRLVALASHWLDFAERALRGGCFFMAAVADVDGHPGPVRDRVAHTMRSWLVALEGAIRAAQDVGHVDPEIDAAQLAFELNGMELAATWSRQLLDDEGASARARRAIQARIASVTTRAGARVLGRAS